MKEPLPTIRIIRDGPFVDDVLINGVSHTKCATVVDEGNRITIKYNNFIIKVDNAGSQHNEAAIYRRLKSSHKKYFPRLYRVSHRQQYSIHQYVDFKEGGSKENWKKVKYLKKKYNLSDINDDDNPNWGERPDGRPVIFDYGLIY